jgi:hypothetical protein|tara:strand:+ start:3324 stop:4289 length:966 start_codon:yes stop_codon:yes gene_type:complete
MCQQEGHNRRTCPLRNITGLPQHPSTRLSPSPPNNDPPRRNTLTQSFFKSIIKKVIYFQKYSRSVYIKDSSGDSDIRIVYLHWLKVKNLKGHLSDITTGDWNYNIYWRMREEYYVSSDYPDSNGCRNIFSREKNTCLIYHLEFNTPEICPKSDKKKVNLVNLRNENYLIYWVVGNYMISDLDNSENNINYMGLIQKGNNFKLKTIIGHRFYLVPHRLNYEPPYHPRTDKQFFIEPYVQINIHSETKDKVYIDDKQNLSELNRWKFNALKLDYLIREVIKLGGKNNDMLGCILDLHEDIKLDNVSEIEKDIAGIPSEMTNIT